MKFPSTSQLSEAINSHLTLPEVSCLDVFSLKYLTSVSSQCIVDKQKKIIFLWQDPII